MVVWYKLNILLSLVRILAWSSCLYLSIYLSFSAIKTIGHCTFLLSVSISKVTHTTQLSNSNIFFNLLQMTNEKFRITTESLNKLRTTLKLYKGTHNFHNFTARKWVLSNTTSLGRRIQHNTIIYYSEGKWCMWKGCKVYSNVS